MRPAETESNHNAALLELEARLVEQEHRPYRVLYNFLVEMRSWPKGDPRRRAAVSALIWRLLTPTTTVLVVGGGILTFLGVVLALHANALLARQNRLIRVQTTLEESSRRAALVFELSAILDQIDREAREAEAKAMGRASSSGAEGTPEPIALTHRTYGRLVALSRSLRPYHYLDTEGYQGQRSSRSSDERSWLSAVTRAVRNSGASILATFDPETADLGDDTWRLTGLRSPERGQLLISVVASGVRMEPLLQTADFSFADLPLANLGGARLANALLLGANLRGASVVDTDFTAARLTGADLAGAMMNLAILRGAQLHGARLMGASLIGADLSYAVLNDADLSFAFLRNANVHGAHLSGANLEATDLTQEQLDSACATDQTVLPDGVTLPSAIPEQCRESE